MGLYQIGVKSLITQKTLIARFVEYLQNSLSATFEQREKPEACIILYLHRQVQESLAGLKIGHWTRRKLKT